MGSKYSSQSVSGFDSSPPVDDGSATEANKVKWSTIKNKLASPLKTHAEAINTALVTALDKSCRAVTANDSAAASDHDRTIQVTTSSVTITLADATTMAAGYTVSVANQSSGNIAVALATATDTIDGITNVTEVIPAKETRRYIVNTATTGYITSSTNSRKFAAIAAGRNITASRPTAATVDIDADELVLKDSNGRSFVATSVNLTIDITGSGANGLDTGAEAAATWYYGWVVATPGGTVAGLLSTSATSPTLPSGYTFKALVTAVRNDGSSDILAFRQRGNEIFYEAGQSALANGNATTETAASVATLVPSIAHSMHLLLDAKLTSDAGGAASTDVVIAYISASTYSVMRIQVPVVSQACTNTAALWLPNISQQFYYSFSDSATNIASRELDASILGFKLPGGGE